MPFQGRRTVQDVIGGDAPLAHGLRRDGGGDRRFVAGQGAGLVDGDAADRAEPLERGTGLHHDAEAAGRADGRNHGHRHRNGQRARGGGHQHHQGPGDPLDRIAEQGTDDRHDRRQHEHAGHQWPGDAVGDAGAVALLRLGVLDQAHHGGQGIVVAGRGRRHRHRGADRDDAGHDLVAGGDLDRDRLARHGRGIDGGVGVVKQRIRGHPPTRGHRQPHAGTDLARGDGAARTAIRVDHRRRVGDEGEQRTQAAAGAVHRLVLESLRDGVQERQGRGLGDVPEEDGADGADGHEQTDAEAAMPEQAGQRAGHERRRAEQQREPIQRRRGDAGGRVGQRPRAAQRRRRGGFGGVGGREADQERRDQRDAGEHRDEDLPIAPPGRGRGLRLGEVRGFGGNVRAAAGRGHRTVSSVAGSASGSGSDPGSASASAVVLASQQPSTGQDGSRQGASASTASVTSRRSLSALRRCGSAMSYRVRRPSGVAKMMPQSFRHARWLETLVRVSSRSSARAPV